MVRQRALIGTCTLQTREREKTMSTTYETVVAEVFGLEDSRDVVLKVRAIPCNMLDALARLERTEVVVGLLVYEDELIVRAAWHTGDVTARQPEVATWAREMRNLTVPPAGGREWTVVDFVVLPAGNTTIATMIECLMFAGMRKEAAAELAANPTVRAAGFAVGVEMVNKMITQLGEGERLQVLDADSADSYPSTYLQLVLIAIGKDAFDKEGWAAFVEGWNSVANK